MENSEEDNRPQCSSLSGSVPVFSWFAHQPWLLHKVGPTINKCALCMEMFTSPRLLPCFHTFCLACLKRLVQTRPTSRTFPCPTCRTPTTIPAGGVEKFQVNFYIEAEVEGQGQGSGKMVRVCDMCQKQPVTHKCSDCNQFACDTCTAIHASIAATRSHTVLRLKDLKGPGQSHSKVTRERFCVTHTEEKIRFFCNQCCKVICRDCKLTSHEGHNTTDLSAKSSEVKQLILKVTKLSRENLEPKLRQQLKKAGDHQKKLQDKKRELQALLERRAGELKEKIDQSLSRAKQKLEKETGSLNNTAAACMDAMDMELAGFLSLTEHAERVAHGGCQADIMEIPELMKQFWGLSKQQRKKLRAQRMIPVEQDEVQDPHKSYSHKLKSFTNSRWKVTVQMKEEDENSMTVCDGCGYYYDENSHFCTRCDHETEFGVYEVQGFMYSSPRAARNTQYRNCRQMFSSHLESCPSCGRGSSDIKVTIEKTISDYIGDVKVISEKAEALTSQILNDITTLQSYLSGSQKTHDIADRYDLI